MGSIFTVLTNLGPALYLELHSLCRIWRLFAVLHVPRRDQENQTLQATSLLKAGSQRRRFYFFFFFLLRCRFRCRVDAGLAAQACRGFRGTGQPTLQRAVGRAALGFIFDHGVTGEDAALGDALPERAAWREHPAHRNRQVVGVRYLEDGEHALTSSD